MTRQAIRDEVRPAVRDPARVRKRRGDTDKFFVDLDKKPDDQDWNWKRKEIIGKEDRHHQIAMMDNGWLPVDSSVFNKDVSGPVEIDDMVLMERPEYLSQEARDEDLRSAKGQLRDQMAVNAQASSEANPRDHAKTRPQLKRGFAPMDVAD